MTKKQIYQLTARKYSIASLLSAYSEDEQPHLRACLCSILEISPRMLTNYINARRDDTIYVLNSDKMKKIQELFGLKSIDDVFNTPPQLDEAVLSAFNNRVSST